MDQLKEFEKISPPFDFGKFVESEFPIESFKEIIDKENVFQLSELAQRFTSIDSSVIFREMLQKIIRQSNRSLEEK